MPDENSPPKKGIGDTLLLACGALAHDIIALNKANGWDCFTVDCIPASVHFTPEKIPGAVREKIQRARGQFREIYVLFGDCGTAGDLDVVLEEEGVERIAGPHCFSFLAGNDDFDVMANGDGVSAFYLSDFMVKHFDAFLWKGLWLDKHPELIEMYFANYTKVIHTAQVKDEALQARARECAEKLGLDYEYRFTGYGDLSGFMRNAVPITNVTNP
ncbi:MAG: DUF1638 domain-containing protein [Pseudomonadota bacterium]